MYENVVSAETLPAWMQEDRDRMKGRKAVGILGYCRQEMG